MSGLKRPSFQFVPSEVLDIAEALYGAGFDVWIVGGALRDFLLGVVPKDWDLATDASSQDVMRIFPRVIPVGIRHGTVRLPAGTLEVEVTSCPSSGWEGMLADLSRRDFTVNALALGYPAGNLLDPHRGRRDLSGRILRAVGDARSRLIEDPLRVLRAFRLVSLYGFRIHEETFKALEETAPELNRTAAERIREEVYKLVTGKNVFSAFEGMRHGGVLNHVIPELVQLYSGQSHGTESLDAYHHTLATLQSCPARLTLRLAALFHAIGGEESGQCPEEASIAEVNFERSAETAAEVLARWRASGRQIRNVTGILRTQVPVGVSGWESSALRRYLASMDPGLMEDVLDLACADRSSRKNRDVLLRELMWFRSRMGELLSRKEVVRMGDLAVDGNDVMAALGLDPGPAVGRLLRVLHEKVLEDPRLNERKILVDFLKEITL